MAYNVINNCGSQSLQWLHLLLKFHHHVQMTHKNDRGMETYEMRVDILNSACDTMPYLSLLVGK